MLLLEQAETDKKNYDLLSILQRFFENFALHRRNRERSRYTIPEVDWIIQYDPKVIIISLFILLTIKRSKEINTIIFSIININ